MTCCGETDSEIMKFWTMLPQFGIDIAENLMFEKTFAKLQVGI